MAATKLIAMHRNKGRSVMQCLKDRTDYAMNGEKTDEGKYISSYQCNPELVDLEFAQAKKEYLHKTWRQPKGDVIAYQIRQSFKPGEITPEEANEVGYETGMRFTKGKHAFIVATHVDRAHIHNHIIFNSTNLECDRKFRDFWFSGIALQRLSDIICLEHGLSVIPKVSVNVQHSLNTDMEKLNSLIREECLFDVVSKKMIINQDSGFVKGGIENDTGLTGRKVMVDTYGGLAPHGGGAFSGKDPSKVDRSAAYMCRFVAKNIVANGLARECCVSVSYNFGEENPAMISIETNQHTSSNISKIVLQNFDFRPQAIIERLNLKNIKYQPTATYGHFTNPTYPWERVIELI